jgi:sulfur carrier protein
MNITLNNRPETFEGHEKITIEQLLELKKFSYKMLLIRVNNNTIKSDDYNKTIINDGDNVAVIHLMAGG